MIVFNKIIVFFLINMAAYSFCDILDEEEEQRHRYIPYIDDNGVSHLLDTQPAPTITMLPRFRVMYIENEVNFFLYTRQNKVTAQTLSIGNMTELKRSNFNSDIPTVFIVHGWWSSSQTGPNPSIKDAFLKKMNVNVVIVDWSYYAHDPNYFDSVRVVPDVGTTVAKLMKFLNEKTGASLNEVHLIGHSLGAHVVGNAGRAEQLKGAKVARITALDPAGPLWSDNPNRLKGTDAKYVEAIHTNGGPAGLGTLKQWGTANFYPNGGILQPGCLLPTCSHKRSYELFITTIEKNNLFGRKCSGITAMIFHNCHGELSPMGNGDITKFGSGIYRVDTSSLPPYLI